MILALRAGYSPTTLATLSPAFRAAAHWALFVEAWTANGIPDVAQPIPAAADPATVKAIIHNREVGVTMRAVLFPEDDDDG